MATKRNVAAAPPTTEEKPAYNQSAAQLSQRKSNTSPAVPTPVIAKLIIFSIAMLALPLGTYFATVDAVFNGSTTWAGASAAIVANVVLIGYIIVAMMDDQNDREEDAKKSKKAL